MCRVSFPKEAPAIAVLSRNLSAGQLGEVCLFNGDTVLQIIYPVTVGTKVPEVVS